MVKIACPLLPPPVSFLIHHQISGSVGPGFSTASSNYATPPSQISPASTSGTITSPSTAPRGSAGREPNCQPNCKPNREPHRKAPSPPILVKSPVTKSFSAAAKIPDRETASVTSVDLNENFSETEELIKSSPKKAGSYDFLVNW